MTEKKPSEQQAKYECKKDDCIYKGTAGGIKICDYFGITGKLRRCSVQECTKYAKKKQRSEQKMNRAECLKEAEKVVCKDREAQYGRPEDNFTK